MIDQASGLRQLMKAPVASGCRVIVVCSGKGGVGKTTVTANLALTLQARGKRVLLVDADLGLANIDVLLGVVPPYHLGHVRRGDMGMRDIIFAHSSGVGLVAGASGLFDLLDLDRLELEHLVQDLVAIESEYDIVLIDTGAGVGQAVLTFLEGADHVIVVTTPEPTALTDAYALMKLSVHQNVRNRFEVVINRCRDDAEGVAIADRLIRLAERFLHAPLTYLGAIPDDAAVGRSVRSQVPLVLGMPQSAAARAIGRLGNHFVVAPRTPTKGLAGLLLRLKGAYDG